MPKITKKVVDSAVPKPRRYIIWDDTLPGFGLVVQHTGYKSYCFQYRNRHGRSCRIVLGKHGPITADMARKKAKDLNGKVSAGDDPLEAKRADRAALTVGQMLAEYCESEKFAQKTEITQKNDTGRIKRHLVPLLGRKVAEKVTADQIRKASADIEKGRTAKTVKTGPRGLARVTGGPGAARMAIRLLKSAYSWAHDEGLVSANPAKVVRVGQDRRRNATLTQGDYEKVFSAITDLENEARISRPAANAIRVIALTGARRGEIAGLRWGYLDLKKGVVEIPPESHKTGKHTGQAREIGLPSAAQIIISQQPAGGPQDYVFPPASGRGPIALSKPWRLIREKAEIDPTIGLHGLRHSLATHMAMAGASATHIMAVIGHRNLSTSQGYVHLAQDFRAELAEKAAAGVAAALEGRESATVESIKVKK